MILNLSIHINVIITKEIITKSLPSLSHTLNGIFQNWYRENTAMISVHFNKKPQWLFHKALFALISDMHLISLQHVRFLR